MPILERKTAIVTGASSGIGRATAEMLGAAGAHVFLAGRTAAAMELSKKKIEEAGGKASVVTLDVRDIAQVQELVETAMRPRPDSFALAATAATALSSRLITQRRIASASI